VVGTRLTAADGDTVDADVVFFDPSSRARVVLEVSIATVGSDTSLWRGARAGAGLDSQGWMGLTRSCERVRRTSAIIGPSEGCLTRRREMKLF